MTLLVALGIPIAIVILAAAAIFAIRRDARRRGSGAFGHAVQEMEGLLVESKRHVLKAERAEEAEEEEGKGDPPVK